LIAFLAQGIVSGVVIGLVYALIALSIVFIYKSTDVANFAGGEVVMIGGYGALLALSFFQWHYVFAFILVAAVTFIGGCVFDRAVLDKVLGRSMPGQSIMVSMVISTIGLSYLLRGLVRVVPYTEQVRRVPPLFAGPPVFLGPVVVQRQDIAICVIAPLIIIAAGAFFRATLLGKALLATAENPRAAVLVGIPVKAMRSLVWGLASSIAAVSGALLAPKLLLTPDMGDIIIMAFAAAIIGGLTNLPGCILGGIILGVVQNLVGLFISSSAMAVAPFVAIMLVLVIRPQGLLGGRTAMRKV